MHGLSCDPNQIQEAITTTHLLHPRINLFNLPTTRCERVGVAIPPRCVDAIDILAERAPIRDVHVFEQTHIQNDDVHNEQHLNTNANSNANHENAKRETRNEKTTTIIDT